MSVERRTAVIPATGVIELGVGNFFLLLSASGSVNARAENGGVSEGFNGVTGGILIKRIRPWENMRVLGTAGVALEYIVGSERVDRDETDVRLQIATIAGTVPIVESPSSAVADTPIVTRATASQGVLFAANLLRKRVSVFVDATNAGSCFARIAGGANNIAELQPGVAYEFKGTYALDVRNDTGANAVFYIFEEA